MWKKGEPDTQTHTHIYCNPAAHARQGLIMIKWVTLQCASIHCCKKLILYLVRPGALTHKSQGQKEKQTCVWSAKRHLVSITPIHTAPLFMTLFGCRLILYVTTRFPTTDLLQNWSTRFETGQPISQPWSACVGSHIARVEMHSPVISVNPIYRIDNHTDDL